MSAGKMQAAAFNMFVLALPLITPIIFRCVLDFRSDLDWGVLNSFVSGFLITVFMLGLAIWRVCYREYMSAIVCILLVVSFWCLLLPERGTRDLTSQLYYYLNREPISRYTAVAVASGEELSRFEISSFGVGGYNFSRYVLIKRSGLLPSQLTAGHSMTYPTMVYLTVRIFGKVGTWKYRLGPESTWSSRAVECLF